MYCFSFYYRLYYPEKILFPDDVSSHYHDFLECVTYFLFSTLIFAEKEEGRVDLHNDIFSNNRFRMAFDLKP